MNATTSSGLFITGTDTGVGKTVIAAAIGRCLINRGFRVGAMKPVATGATRASSGWVCEDARILSEAITGKEAAAPYEKIAPLMFEEPLAPSVASRRASEPLEFARIWKSTQEAIQWWRDSAKSQFMIVEGVGGWLCPLTERETVADLATALDFPLVIVARLGLGTLNHTLLTVESVLRRGVRIAGLVLNAVEPSGDSLADKTNPEELMRHLDNVPILTVTSYAEDFSSIALHPEFQRVDWENRACRPRHTPFPP